jgi:hypothetical protein
VKRQVCTSSDMKLQEFRTAGLIGLALWTGTAPASALDVQSSVWQRFTLDSGASAGLSFRSYSAPQLAPGLTPMVGLNYENAHLAGSVRGAWLEAGRVGAFAAGPVMAVERHIALSGRAQTARDQDAALRFGGFLSYAESGQEFGRLTLTTGRTGGLDIKATRSFKLNDTVSLDIGPTISLGSFRPPATWPPPRCQVPPRTRIAPSLAPLVLPPQSRPDWATAPSHACSPTTPVSRPSAELRASMLATASMSVSR